MARGGDRMHFRPILALGIIVIGTSTAAAQPRPGTERHKPSGRYVEFDFDVNAETLVQDRLNQLKDIQAAQDLIKRLLDDPGRFHFDKQMIDALKNLKLNDRRVQEHLRPWVKKSTEDQPPVPPTDLDRFQQEVKKAVEAQNSQPPQEDASAEPASAESPAEEAPPADAETGMRDWLQGVMERAEESHVGEWLRGSPAFQKALQELHGSRRMPNVQPGRWGLDRLLKLDKLPIPDAKTLERLGQFKPKLPHINPPPLPSLSRPALSSVSAPTLPTLSSLGTLATWLLCLAIVALLAWQTSRWINISARTARAGTADIGPWPVPPSAVSTRTELVQAFDHLALLLLGMQARAWHHRAVAQAIAHRAAASTAVAVQLAALYEQARYTEGAETLAAEDRDRARAALTHLAGAAA